MSPVPVLFMFKSLFKMDHGLIVVCFCFVRSPWSFHDCKQLLVLGMKNVTSGCTTISESETSLFDWVCLAKVQLQLQLHHKRILRFHRIRGDRCNLAKALLPRSVTRLYSKNSMEMGAVAEAIDGFLTPGEHTFTVR